MRKLFVFGILVLLCFSCKKDDTEGITLVINEIMPVNTYTIMDQDNEFDDWVELYNATNSKIDLSGYYFSDSKKNPAKWKFPDGTNIAARSYLIVWTDADSTQYGLHTNFKLSSSGEKLVLSNRAKKIVDAAEYETHTGELTYSRVPNGTGAFKWKIPTFNASNN